LDWTDEQHLSWLREQVIHPEAGLAADQSGCYIAPESGEIFAARVRVKIGECAGNLRNALNYLTCVVAEQDAGTVGKQIQFPIDQSPQIFESHVKTYLEGISTEHVDAFRRFQPYNGVAWIKQLQKLSNWYRHKGLITVQKVFQKPESSTVSAERSRVGNVTVETRSDFLIAISLENRQPVV